MKRAVGRGLWYLNGVGVCGGRFCLVFNGSSGDLISCCYLMLLEEEREGVLSKVEEGFFLVRIRGRRRRSRERTGPFFRCSPFYNIHIYIPCTSSTTPRLSVWIADYNPFLKTLITFVFAFLLKFIPFIIPVRRGLNLK